MYYGLRNWHNIAEENVFRSLTNTKQIKKIPEHNRDWIQAVQASVIFIYEENAARLQVGKFPWTTLSQDDLYDNQTKVKKEASKRNPENLCWRN